MPRHSLTMHSRIYKGWVRHRRTAPTQNSFRYRLFMLYLDLAELPGIFDGVPGWSAERRALAWFKRSDYLGDPGTPLDTAVRDLVLERTGGRPTGPIRLLTHLRYFGYCMNPVSFYYCFDADGERLETIVAEITNTPWKERHQYVLSIDSASIERAAAVKRFAFDKNFHVSPFLPMDMRYRWSFTEPLDQLIVNMQNLQDDTCLFDATLALEAEPVTTGALLRVLITFPLMTVKVVTAIHFQALKLWLKRTPFYNHPSLPGHRAAATPTTSSRSS